MAIEFNYYFLNIGQSLSDTIHYSHPYDQYLTKTTHSCITCGHVSENVMLDIINKLENKLSFGHDEISNKFIENSKEVLVKPLALIVNQLLSSWIFPDDF